MEYLKNQTIRSVLRSISVILCILSFICLVSYFGYNVNHTKSVQCLVLSLIKTKSGNLFTLGVVDPTNSEIGYSLYLGPEEFQIGSDFECFIQNNINIEKNMFNVYLTGGKTMNTDWLAILSILFLIFSFMPLLLLTCYKKFWFHEAKSELAKINLEHNLPIE